jgi:hypothetical protein
MKVEDRMKDEGENVDKSDNASRFNFVLKNDKFGPTIADESLPELLVNLLKCGAVGG